MAQTSTFSVPVQQPCYGYLKLGKEWQQVKCLRALHRPEALVFNEVAKPDGTILVIDSRKIKFKMPRANFVEHPDAPNNSDWKRLSVG